MTERAAAGPQAPGAGLAPEKLVNLTGHPVSVDALGTSPAGDDGGSPAPSRATFAPDGPAARVADDQARLGDGRLNTPDGLVRVTRLRRSGLVIGLPPATPGTRYLVSRVTALAARDRDDLVFPFEEQRDAQHRVIAVSGLAAFRPRKAIAGRYRDWRAAAAERRSGRPLAREWRTGVLFALATALLSAWLGLLPGTVDNAIKNGFGGGGQGWTAGLTVAFFVLGVAALVHAALRWYRRLTVLAGRGTAYVIEEEAIAWRHEEKQWVLSELNDNFARVLRVPGPEALGERWRWQADAEGAPEWDRRADQLVQSFWAVHYNDDQVTRNAVFVWAPWPVAMAFGARATTRRRGLVLHVRQRPSGGAEGQRHELHPEDPAHDFIRDSRTPTRASQAPPHEVLAGSVPVRIETLGAAGAPATRPGGAAFPPVRLLLVRIVQGDIGGIPLDLPETPPITLHVPGCLTGSALRPGEHTMKVAEWRLAGADGAHVRWKAFPAVAQAIADWIAKDAEDNPRHVFLLAARMPQETAVGVGIQMGQLQSIWPHRLYPVHYAGGKLYVPKLDLGRGSVRPERG